MFLLLPGLSRSFPCLVVGAGIVLVQTEGTRCGRPWAAAERGVAEGADRQSSGQDRPILFNLKAMFAWPQPVLTTIRLRLRPLQPSDAARVQELAGAREIADTTLLIPHPYADGLAEKWIDTAARDWKDGRMAVFAIVPRETDLLLGAIALKLEPEYSRAELGYWVGIPFWGRGYATEAGRAMLRFGFEELSLNRIFAFYFSRNPASGRVLEKLGLRPEGRMREHVRRWDRFEDLDCRGILRSEWAGRERPM